MSLTAAASEILNPKPFVCMGYKFGKTSGQVARREAQARDGKCVSREVFA